MTTYLRHVPRGALAARPRAVLAALSALLLLCFGQPSANASIPPTIDSTNWSGVVGRPIAAENELLTHVEMYFQIPKLTCTKELGEVSIWAGLSRGKIGEAQPGGGVSQAGVIGDCRNGRETWFGFWESYPELNPQRTAELEHLAAGDSVKVDVDFLGGNQFKASFVVYKPGKPGLFVTRIFHSKQPGDRTLAECILERPGNGARSLPKFADRNGGAVGAVCSGGTAKVQEFVAGPKSNFEYEDIYAKGSGSHLLVKAWSEVGGLVFYEWRASR